jgi:hypothetical protein
LQRPLRTHGDKLFLTPVWSADTPAKACVDAAAGDAWKLCERRLQKKITGFPAFFSRRDLPCQLAGHLTPARGGEIPEQDAPAGRGQAANIFRKGVDTSKKRD